jgi:uncharacterized protein YegJ (DUF2314 family)
MFVKLYFATSDVWGKHNWGEGMWVEVVAVERRHLVGVLSNQPIGIPRLDMGDTVKFKRRHIINIYWECTRGAADRGHQPVHDECSGLSELTAEDPELPPPPEPLAD